MAVDRKPLCDQVLKEWDTARRTAEFFDEQIGKIREIAFTVSAGLLGVAFQYNISMLYLATLPLEIGFLVIDFRYQTYLDAVSKYAKEMEKQYQFAFEGITHKIDEARASSRGYPFLRAIVFCLYLSFMIIALYGLFSPWLRRLLDC